MIRRCEDQDIETIYTIINEAAQAYRGVIPPDRWHEPYMSLDELRQEIEDGVVFWGIVEEGRLLGVMGLQDRGDVLLIRHAYVRAACQRRGIGGQLLEHLLSQVDRPVLIGTWADATWAIRFYQKAGFRLVAPEEKERLLRRYWRIPERQVETSVVLADARWFAQQNAANQELSDMSG
ncbi:MAG: GNAT family N-acetyltransferase [Chloroflexi bacterium]|jgi:N-acetylglutamate synthase-like GNAT family acetyltransferase|nr:GNAT family N-acetyltransferase [Chloroflexota bacterium]